MALDGTYDDHYNLMKLGGSLGNVMNGKKIVMKTRYISDC
jgi:hypothetical protein